MKTDKRGKRTKHGLVVTWMNFQLKYRPQSTMSVCECAQRLQEGPSPASAAAQLQFSNQLLYNDPYVAHLPYKTWFTVEVQRCSFGIMNNTKQTTILSYIVSMLWLFCNKHGTNVADDFSVFRSDTVWACVNTSRSCFNVSISGD